LQNQSSERNQALTFIVWQINIHKIIAASILFASIISTTMFFGYAINNDHIRLLPSVGMMILLVSMWIANSHHAEMANRYQSLFEKVAKHEKPQPQLYVKRPIRENVSAMWNRAEIIFFVGAIVIISLISFNL